MKHLPLIMAMLLSGSALASEQYYCSEDQINGFLKNRTTGEYEPQLFVGRKFKMKLLDDENVLTLNPIQRVFHRFTCQRVRDAMPMPIVCSNRSGEIFNFDAADEGRFVNMSVSGYFISLPVVFASPTVSVGIGTCRKLEQLSNQEKETLINQEKKGEAEHLAFWTKMGRGGENIYRKFESMQRLDVEGPLSGLLAYLEEGLLEGFQTKAEAEPAAVYSESNKLAQMASRVGLVAAAIGVAIPMVLWLVVMRNWSPNTRYQSAFKFSLWPIIILTFKLGGPISREIFGIESLYLMDATRTVKGLIGLGIVLIPVFFLLGMALWKPGKPDP